MDTLDFPYTGNFLTELPESDYDMANQPERIASLESDKKWHWVALGAVAAIGFAWLSWTRITLFSIKGDMQAIKQKMKDGGLGDIVAELNAPTSLQQLQANLTMVSAQIQTARVNGKPPDPQKVESLSGVLTKVVKRNPELPEGWRAAVQLVDYKFQAPASTVESINCLDTVLPNSPEVDRLYTSEGSVDYPQFSGPQTPGWMSHVLLGHCTLNLDDDGDFSSTPVGKFFDNVKAHHPQATIFVLVLDDVHIVYSGGKTIPITGIEFTRCYFDFKPPVGLPDTLSRSITTQLLAANPPNGRILLSTEPPATHS